MGRNTLEKTCIMETQAITTEQIQAKRNSEDKQTRHRRKQPIKTGKKDPTIYPISSI